jgi:tape measure domain-containing protein
MAEDYSVRAILSATDRGFSSTLKSALGTTESLADKIKNGFAFGVLTGAGQQAFSAITNGAKEMVGEINSSVKTWKTFEGNMKNFGKSKKEIAGVKKELQSYAETTVYSSSDMASTYAQLEAVGVGSMKSLSKGTSGLVKGFGGLAAAAEDPGQAMKSLSQQATQMAAKPKVAWEDFKIMLEQSPAGMSAVAKSMGISTSQLISKIQDGKVSTEDFFAAVEKAGTSEGFQKMATEAKTMDQAMDGLKEGVANKLMPAFEVFSQYGIKAIDAISNALGKINADSLAAKVQSGLDTAAQYFNVFKDAFSGVGTEVGEAITALKNSFSGMSDGIDVNALDVFKSAVEGAATGIKTFANFVEEHSDAIAKVTPYVAGLAIAFKGFSIVKSIVPGVGAFTSAITGLAGKGISAIAGKLFGVAAGETAAGTASKASSKQVLAAAKSFMMMGAAVLMISAGFALLAYSAIQLANSGGLAIGVMVGMAAAMVGLMIGMTAMIKSVSTSPAKLTKMAMALLSLGAAVLMVSAGFALLAYASISLANAGAPAIAVMVGMVATIALLAVGAAALAPALTAGAVGLIAFGAAMVLIATSAVIAGAALAIVSAVLPTIVQYGISGAVSIAALGASMVAFAVGAGAAGAACIVLGAGLTVAAVGLLAAGAATLVLAAGVTLLSAGILITSASLTLLATQLPMIASYGTQAAVSITALGASMVVFAAGALAAGAACLVLGAGLTAAAIGIAAAGVAVLVLASGITVLSVGALITAASLALLATQLPVIAAYGTQASGAIVALGGGLVVFAAGAAAGGVACVALGAGLVAVAAGMVTVSAGSLAAAVGITALAAGAALLAGSLTLTGAAAIVAGSGFIVASGGAMTCMASFTAVMAVTVALMASMAALNAPLLAVVASSAAAGAGMLVLAAGMTAAAAGTAVMSAALKAVKSSLKTISSSAKSTKSSLKDMTGSVKAVSSGLDTLGGKAKSALNSLKNAFDSSANSAKTAGQKVGKNFDSGMHTGLKSAANNAKNATKQITTSLKTASNNAKSAGKTFGTGYANSVKTGLRSAVTAASTAVNNVTSRLRSGRSGAYSAGSYVSQGFASGMRSCLSSIRAAARDMVAAADAAVKAKAKIHSPSKLFAKSGRYIAEGLGVGIANYIKKATAASTKLAKQTFTAFKKANGNYEKLGESLAKKYSSGMKTQKSNTTSAVKDLIDRDIEAIKKKNDTALANLKKNNEAQLKQYKKGSKAYKAAQKRLNNSYKAAEKKYKAQSKSYDKVGDKLYEQFKKKFESQADKAISAVESKLTALGEKFQKKYDEIVQARQDFRDSLNSVDLYKKNNNGKIVFTDFKAEQKKVNTLSSNLAKLKKLKMPKGMMDEIVSMDTASGLEFTNALLNMSSKQLKAYAKDYSNFRKTTKAVSDKYYKQDLANVKKDFNASVTKEMKNLNKKLNQIGVDAMKGLISGMNSQKKNLDKAGKSLADTIMNSFKKKLKIHSPSREFINLAHYIGAGIVSGMNDMVHDVKTATMNLVSIPSVQTPQLALAYGGELASEYDYYRHYEYTIEVPLNVDGKEFARATAQYTQEELDRNQTRAERKLGRR